MYYICIAYVWNDVRGSLFGTDFNVSSGTDFNVYDKGNENFVELRMGINCVRWNIVVIFQLRSPVKILIKRM